MKEITTVSELTRNCIVNTFLSTYHTCRNSHKMTQNLFYQSVFKNHIGKSKYQSNDAFSEEFGNTDDHYLSPRLMIAAVINLRKDILFDPIEFANIFNLCSETVRITKNQNNLVRYKTEDHKKSIKKLTIEKYDDFGPWWDEKTDCFDVFPLKNKVPDFFTEYEKTLLI